MDSILKTFSTIKDKIVKTPLERLVYDACTDENWGVPNTSLHEISQRTFNPEERKILMNAVWELLKSPPKEWRRLYKVLNLLDHLVKFGSDACLNEISSEMYKIRTFQDFSYREGIEEKGVGVRDKARYLGQMLSDRRNLDEEREKAHKLWNKFNGGSGSGQYSANYDRHQRSSNWETQKEPQRSWENNQNVKQAGGLFRETESVKEVSSQHVDIFKMPDVKPKTDLWKTENVKVLKPPTGFNPTGLQNKPTNIFEHAPAKTLHHSQSVSSNHFDLLFNDPPSSTTSSSFDPFAQPVLTASIPKSTQNIQKFNSASLDSDWFNPNPNPHSPNPDINKPPVQSSNFPMFEPIKSVPPTLTSLNLEIGQNTIQGVKPSHNNADFTKGTSIPSDLFIGQVKSAPVSNNPQSNLPIDLFSSGTSGSRPNINPQVANTKKLNVNIEGSNGTTIADMKLFGKSEFSQFMTAPVRKEADSLESKLFDLDNLSKGQPKAKELTKSKW